MSMTLYRIYPKAAKLGTTQLNRWMAGGGRQAVQRYLAGGRPFRNSNTDDLVALWNAAARAFAERPSRKAKSCLLIARAELALRQLQPPYD
jgi:hypothetical protein